MTRAEIIELAQAAARRGRRGPPADYGRFPPALSDDELAGFLFFDQTDRRLIARRRQVEVSDWLEARAWVGAESHRVLFDRAVDHLVASKVLLPGASVLWRVVGAVRQRANERGWTLVAGPLTDAEREGLLALLVASGDDGDMPYERLRHGPVKPTAGRAGRAQQAA